MKANSSACRHLEEGRVIPREGVESMSTAYYIADAFLEPPVIPREGVESLYVYVFGYFIVNHFPRDPERGS